MRQRQRMGAVKLLPAFLPQLLDCPCAHKHPNAALFMQDARLNKLIYALECRCGVDLITHGYFRGGGNLLSLREGAGKDCILQHLGDLQKDRPVFLKSAWHAPTSLAHD